MHFYNAVTAAGTWAAVACALIVVWRQNRSAKELISLQLFLQLHSQYDSELMQRKRAALARKLLSDPQTLDIDDTVLVFFETLATMSRRKLLDRDLVWTTFSIDLCSYWAALRHYVQQIREDLDDQTLFEEMQTLNDTLLSEDTPKRGASGSQIGVEPKAIKQFLEWETRRGAQ